MKYPRAISAFISIPQAIMLTFLLNSTAYAQNHSPRQDPWPSTVEAAVSDLLSQLSEKDKATLRKTKREDLVRYHHGLGTGIRNHYGLWKGNEALKESLCGKPCHPDTASMVMIEKAWEALQK